MCIDFPVEAASIGLRWVVRVVVKGVPTRLAACPGERGWLGVHGCGSFVAEPAVRIEPAKAESNAGKLAHVYTVSVDNPGAT
ncbi:MAG: hypothetical protein EXR69_04035 [Myxococcales bacterium]|nr:hypothetical protein [Myxococcales bacterium]